MLRCRGQLRYRGIPSNALGCSEYEIRGASQALGGRQCLPQHKPTQLEVKRNTSNQVWSNGRVVHTAVMMAIVREEKSVKVI